MRAILMELHAEMAQNQHEGEELVFGVRGSSLIRVGSQTLVIQERQIATFDPTYLHTYAPAPDTTPSLLLSVYINRPVRRRSANRA
jgi:hypothetical protein